MSPRDHTPISIPSASVQGHSARHTARGTHDGPAERGFRQGLAHSAGLHLGNGLLHVIRDWLGL
jgi:hypothetical protein